MRRSLDVSRKIRGFFLVHQNIPGRTVGWHGHAEHHLFLPLTGEISVETESGSHTIGPGRLLWIPGGLRHRFVAARTQGERLLCMVEPEAWSVRGGFLRPPCVGAAPPLLKHVIHHLLGCRDDDGADALLTALVKVVVGQVEEHLGGGDLLAGLARASGLSTRNLNRRFQTEIGLSPKQVQTAIRMDVACTLLRTSRLSVTEIALEVGYASLSHFARLFREHHGMIPMELREREGVPVAELER